MNEPKTIIQGIDNFKRIIDLNGYYVDKTELIKDIIDTKNQIILITRPRRFGKTLNMSMLKYFFEIPKCRELHQEDVDVSYLFEGLKIFENNKYREFQGNYPVVYLTFKDAKQSTWEDTNKNIQYIISNEYKRHQYMVDKINLNEVEKEEYLNIINLKASNVQYTNAIKNLTEYLKRYYKKNCYVIIDEYDTSIQAGYINGYFNEVTEFFKTMLVKGFKDNLALEQGVLTGIMKVAQESIFSDFNNPTVATILSEAYKSRFGFTEDEVITMLKYYDLEEKFDEIKNWYNGYIFGLDTVIYNPWSIIRYMSSPIEGFKPYWVNTSDNRVIKQVMQLNKKEGKEIVEKLINGEEVRKVIEENVVYQSIMTNENSAWSFLLHAGYLKAVDRIKERNRFSYKLEIPNIEVRVIYDEMIIKFFEEDEKISSKIEGIIDGLFNNNFEKFKILIEELYFKYISFHDPNAKENNDLDYDEQEYRHENFHHGFILGLLMFAINKYDVYSNREIGLGRPDIVLIPKDNKKTAYVFEFKWDSTKGKKTLEELVTIANEQIEKNKYIEGVKAIRGTANIKAICFGFKGKEVLLKY